MVMEMTINSDKETRKAPFEDVLLEGVKKLDSQILIFLILYMIVLSGMISKFNTLSLTIQLAIVILPLVGIIAFLFHRRNGVLKQAMEKINIYVGTISDNARVVGRQGSGDSRDINLKVGNASGSSQTIGMVSPATTNTQASPNELEDALLSNFRKMELREKIALLQQLDKTR